MASGILAFISFSYSPYLLVPMIPPLLLFDNRNVLRAARPAHDVDEA